MSKKEINYQYVAEEYYKKVNDFYQDKDQSYPHDILIDVQSIMKYKPDTALFFLKEYCSTYFFHITDKSPFNQEYGTASAYYNSYLCMFNFFLSELSSFKMVLFLYHGKISEYDLQYDHNKERILLSLKFFYEMHYRLFLSCIDENNQKDIDAKEKAQIYHKENNRLFDLYFKQLNQV